MKPLSGVPKVFMTKKEQANVDVASQDRSMNNDRVLYEPVAGASCPSAAAGSHSHDSYFSSNPNMRLGANWPAGRWWLSFVKS